MDIRNRDTPENRDYWDFIERTAAEVRATRPSWHREMLGGAMSEGEQSWECDIDEYESRISQLHQELAGAFEEIETLENRAAQRSEAIRRHLPGALRCGHFTTIDMVECANVDCTAISHALELLPRPASTAEER